MNIVNDKKPSENSLIKSCKQVEERETGFNIGVVDFDQPEESEKNKDFEIKNKS